MSHLTSICRSLRLVTKPGEFSSNTASVMLRYGMLHKILDSKKYPTIADIKAEGRRAFRIDACDLERIKIYSHASSTPLPDDLHLSQVCAGDFPLDLKVFNKIFVQYGDRIRSISLDGANFYRDLLNQLKSVFWLPNVRRDYLHYFTSEYTLVSDLTAIPDLSVAGTPGSSVETPIVLKTSHRIAVTFKGRTRYISNTGYWKSGTNQLLIEPCYDSLVERVKLALRLDDVDNTCIKLYYKDGQQISPDSSISLIENPTISAAVVGKRIMLYTGTGPFDGCEEKFISCDSDIGRGGLGLMLRDKHKKKMVYQCADVVEGLTYEAYPEF